MNTFLIIALCLILIFQVGIFLVSCAIWIERSPLVKDCIDNMREVEKLSKQVDGAVKSAKGLEAHTHSAVYHINKDRTANLIKKAWEGAEAAEKIKRGDTTFRTEKITVYNPPKKAKKPAKKTQSKKPVKRSGNITNTKTHINRTIKNKKRILKTLHTLNSWKKLMCFFQFAIPKTNGLYAPKQL